jgi:hypothetical protein
MDFRPNMHLYNCKWLNSKVCFVCGGCGKAKCGFENGFYLMKINDEKVSFFHEEKTSTYIVYDGVKEGV